MFETTQRLLVNLKQMKYLEDIREAFGIDWTSVEWKDLRKPLYSALGARLFVALKSSTDSVPVPRAIDDQARYGALTIVQRQTSDISAHGQRNSKTVSTTCITYN